MTQERLPSEALCGTFCGRTCNSLFLSFLFIKVPSRVFFSFFLKFLLLEEGGLKKSLTFSPQVTQQGLVRTGSVTRGQRLSQEWGSGLHSRLVLLLLYFGL